MSADCWQVAAGYIDPLSCMYQAIFPVELDPTKKLEKTTDSQVVTTQDSHQKAYYVTGIRLNIVYSKYLSLL